MGPAEENDDMSDAHVIGKEYIDTTAVSTSKKPLPKTELKVKKLKVAAKKVMALNKSYNAVVNCPFSTSKCGSMTSFRSFAVAAMNSNTFESSHVKDWGSNDLCPLILKSQASSFHYKFPETETNLNAEELTPFCFPHGLKIRTIPKCALHGARRLGWMGIEADEYQLHAVRLLVAFILCSICSHKYFIVLINSI